MTRSTKHPEGLANSVEVYQRLAAMDPPAMRSLAAELERLADESSAVAVQAGSAEAAARAGRSAERAAAAQAALAGPDPKG